MMRGRSCLLLPLPGFFFDGLWRKLRNKKHFLLGYLERGFLTFSVYVFNLPFDLPGFSFSLLFGNLLVLPLLEAALFFF